MAAAVEYRYLTREMFESEEIFLRGVKYYYGLWDKLCQRAETNYFRELVDRMWMVTEKIWVHISLSLQNRPAVYCNEMA